MLMNKGKIMTQLKLILIVVLYVLAQTSSLWAACTGSSPSWSSTLDYTSVSECVSNANHGDTITVASGTETWSSTLTITKDISLIGGGIGVSIVNSARIYYNPSTWDNTYGLRISGFTFNGLTTAPIFSAAPTTPTSIGSHKKTKFRMDHCRLVNTATTSAGPLINRPLNVFGVIDNCEFSAGMYAFRAAGYNVYDGWVWQYWAYYPGMQANTEFGHGDNLYVEDSTFEFTGSEDVFQTSQESARWAFRYNTFTFNNATFPNSECHGNWSDGYDYSANSVVGVEMYGNEIIGTASGGEFFDQRGGQAMIFYNSWNAGASAGVIRAREECADSHDTPTVNAITNQTQKVGNTYVFGNKQNYTTGWYGTASTACAIGCCDGSAVQANVDFWTDGDWVAASSGTGCGTLANRPATCTTGVGYWVPSDPTAASCTNLTNHVGANASSPISGTLYKCTATNTWTSFYTPYTYPHPLRGETVATNYSISGGTISGGSIK
jgi:hypothetical protein